MIRGASVSLILALGVATQPIGVGAVAQPNSPRAAAKPIPSAPAMPQKETGGALAPPADTHGPVGPSGGEVPPSPVAVAESLSNAAAPESQTRQVTYTLRQLGAKGPLALRGTSELSGVRFGVRADEVVTAASLKVSGAMSPALISKYSNVTVTLNEQYVGTIPAVDGKPRFDDLGMSISPIFFSADNRLNFRFTGRYTDDCNDPLSGLLWSTISDTSTVTLTLVRVPAVRDLANLPAPFFDPHDRMQLVLPFVTPANADNEELQSAGIVASWFGQLAGFRSSSFPVVAAAPATGNAVVVATASEIPAGINAPEITGPMVAVLPNPNDAAGSVLLVTGRTSDEVVSAAQTLVLGSRSLSGNIASVSAPTMARRAPYDAPAWIPTDRAVKLGELTDPADLVAYGYAPGALHVPFRTAPDLYTWHNRGLPLEVHYRAPPGQILDVAASRLDVDVNNLYVVSFPLAEHSFGKNSWLSWLPSFLKHDTLRQVINADSAAESRTVDLPIYGVFGENDLQFRFDARPLHRGLCVAIPDDLRMSVDPDSTIDLRRAGRMATLPNLASFVSSGFPYTKMADLSETAVVLPSQPDKHELQAYLELLGRIGATTAFPTVRVAVARPNELNHFADRDLLMVGTLPHLQDATELMKNSVFQFSDKSVEVRFGTLLDVVGQMFGESRKKSAQTALQLAAGEKFATVFGTESPLKRGRTLVAVLASDSEALDGVLPVMRNDELATRLQGDLAIVTGGSVTSYRVGDTYTVGHLSPWLYLSWITQDSPVSIIGTLVAGAAALSYFLLQALRRRARRRMPPDNLGVSIRK